MSFPGFPPRPSSGGYPEEVARAGQGAMWLYDKWEAEWRRHRPEHVVVRIGDPESGPYGTVESTSRGFRYHPETPDKRKILWGFIADCHTGQDVRDGAPYGWLPNDEFLRRLPFRFSGYGAWAYIVEDGEEGSA